MSDSDDQDDASKTEEPSQRKLEDARKKGQVAVSRDLSTWIMLVASTVVVVFMMSSLFMDMGMYLRHFIEQSGTLPGAPGGIGVVLSDATIQVLWIMALPMLVLVLAAFLGPFMQVGVLFVPDKIQPDLQKISLAKGWERLFSQKSLLEFVKGLIKISAVSVVTYFVLVPYFPSIEHTVGLDFVSLLGETLGLVTTLMIAILSLLLIFAVMDLLYQRYDLYKRLRMTKQEVKDEYRQTEGDPVVRGRLKQLRMERARKRMMQNVPKADVVITNPTHFAIALQYVPSEMEAPLVLAKGVDEVALRIREVAKEHNIEIVENKPLARTLYDTVEVDKTIPPELYKAVAEVITYVFKKTGKMRG